MSTLVLNADMSPLSVIPLSVINWKDAITATWEGTAVVLEEYDGQDKHSPSITIPLPSVIMLKQYQRPKDSVKYSRYNVFLRDNFKCQYCGEDFSHKKSQLTIDHYHPKAKGGRTSWENSISSCQRCNSKKGHDIMKPLNHEPYKPTYWELVNKCKKHPIIIPDESWIKYLNWDNPEKIIIR